MNEEVFLRTILQRELGTGLSLSSFYHVPGGCINRAVVVNTSKGDFFVKWNAQKSFSFFKKEKNGLTILDSSCTIDVPRVIAIGEEEGIPYLILSYIPSYDLDKRFWEQLGENLAGLHSVKGSQFGFEEDNYIGALDQVNTLNNSWKGFFIDCRLEPQIQMALASGHITIDFAATFREIYEVLADIFPDEPPVLVHGDLWSGNVICGKNSTPYLIDPAVYYANREVEMAFTSLFGGFDTAFYAAYNDRLPLQKGFEERVDLYNLYPLLVHLNLFGLSYLESIRKVIAKYS